MRNQNQPIAVEGYPFIALFAFVTLFFGVMEWYCLTTMALGLTAFTVYFFRNPDRFAPENEKAIVAPADGKVIFVGKVAEERYFEGKEVTKVSIFMNVFNVHVNRAPVDGKVVGQFYNRGRFFNASLDKACMENEQAGMLIETTDGAHKLLCIQIAGLVARRIVTYPVIGDLLERGCRYGLIRFGSR
ncbi:MAG: phosphatidylserine decarboxylase family protein, partial [Desulfuromonadales bacterium]|nr:phosphatidylserine decarboxylase family protein [Desulfuromonadales bacterium]